MTDTSPPFSSRAYSLTLCGLNPLDLRNSMVSAHILASMEPWHSLGYRPEGLSRYLSRTDPALFRYAITSGDETAGVVCIRYPWLMGPFLELLALFAPYQGRGIGHEIVGWIVSQTRGVCRNLWTTVSSGNTDARRFYEAVGFRRIAVLEDLIASGMDEILLRKPLWQSPDRYPSDRQE